MSEYKKLPIHKYDKSNIYFKCYIDCLFEAGVRVGFKPQNMVIYSRGKKGYTGEMDIHFEGLLNGDEVYIFIRQNYGSCSYCDWLESVYLKDHELTEIVDEYEKQIRMVLADIEYEN